jgi:hypothetical protein
MSRLVCGRSGIFAEQLALVDSMAEHHLSFSVTFLLTPAAQLQRDAMQAFVQQRWGIEPAFSEICAREDISKGFRLSHVREGAKPLSPWRSADMFFSRVRKNICAAGNFEIGPDGLLRSCAGLSDIHGDVGRSGLRGALSGAGLYQVWEIDKAGVEPCRRCPLRYACIDCSTFELEGEQDKNVREAYCPHDPSTEALPTYGQNWGRSAFVRTLRLGDTAEEFSLGPAACG